MTKQARDHGQGRAIHDGAAGWCMVYMVAMFRPNDRDERRPHARNVRIGPFGSPADLARAVRAVTGAGDDLAVTFGVEEELFLVDPETREVVSDPDEAIFEDCRRNAGRHKVVRELLRSQVETNTRVCASMAELRGALRETRRIAIDAAARHGVAVYAGSTHPFSSWQAQTITPRERYERFAMTFQENVRRFAIGGMHIHAGFGDAELRIRVMTALRRHLPLLHALSASSPFSEGRETGFKSWRLTLVGGLPRTGIPAAFGSRAEYDRLLDGYRRMSFVEDGSELWWDIRPSHAYPTIELRICDVCPRIEDALCIAALYACLIRRLARLARGNALPPEPLTELMAEDRWIAQRYGVFAHFGDSGGGRVDIADRIDALVEELAADAQALGCEAELGHAPTIVREGAAADRQLDLYRLRCLEGDSEAEALRAVVDLVLAETREGTGDAGG